MNIHLQFSDDNVIETEITNDIFNNPEKYKSKPTKPVSPQKDLRHNPLQDLIVQL